MSDRRYAYPIEAARAPGNGVAPAPWDWWRGRVVELGDGSGVLQGEGRARPFRLDVEAGALRVGDIVSLGGPAAGGALTVRSVEILAPSLRRSVERAPQFDLASRLVLRQQVLGAVRSFFAERGFDEVETPAMVEAPGQEPHLDPFVTDLCGPAGAVGERYLITSPEHHMKRLLGQGCERIYQVCRCFRNGEQSPHHRPEFVMVEWYRAWATYREVAADVADLVAAVSRRVLGTTRIAWEGRDVEMAPPWQSLTVRQAFRSLAGVELTEDGDAEGLIRAARDAGCGSVGDGDSWEDAFHKILLDRVEPALARMGAVVLREYPAPLAALAKLAEGDAAVAERFEAYIGGVELANGFTELNDPRQQRRRFMEERLCRRQRGGAGVPLDEGFLAIMEAGMPPAGGVALGLDRLIMVLAGAASIDEIVAFPGE